MECRSGAFRGIGVQRSTIRYESVREEPTKLVENMKQLAAERPRFGYRGLYRLLRRRGHPREPQARLPVEIPEHLVEVVDD